MLKYLLSICLFSFTFFVANAEQLSQVEYPEDYRDWKHVKSMVIQAGHPLENPFQGIHHIYANDLAIEGLANAQYKDGAVFVFDLLNVLDNQNALVEADRKLVGVMIKDQLKFQNTGGWGFEGFAGNSSNKRLTTDGGESCFGCHTQRTEQDFVFTTLRD